MFVVQSYLGTTVGSAPSFVYYIQGKTREQDQITSEIEDRLFEIGRNLGSESHLFAPHRSAYAEVASEVRSRLGQAFFNIVNRAPGFLILRTQLESYDPSRHEGVFISLKKDGWHDVLDEVERIILEQAASVNAAEDDPIQSNIWLTLNKHLQIAVNIGPLSIGFR